MPPAPGHRSCLSVSVMWILMQNRSMHWLCNSDMGAGKRRLWLCFVFWEAERQSAEKDNYWPEKSHLEFSWVLARTLGRYFPSYLLLWLSLTKARQGTSFLKQEVTVSSNSTQPFPSPMDALSGDNLEQPPGFKEIWLLSRHCIPMSQSPLAPYFELTQANR